ncbi:MAG: hypothetical protein Q4E16_04060 [Neisseria sp.]|nr:hypothetical protein [Neisseria sp.]
MQTASLPKPNQHAQLSTCVLLCDGNAHRPDLLANAQPSSHQHLIAESLLPQIRTTALLIAAARHRFDAPSPQIFADEADWLAARILVLQARVFYLDIKQQATLQTANQRAQAFAKQHNLPFSLAKIRLRLHGNLPAHLLQMECALNVAFAEDAPNHIADSLAVRKEIKFVLA